MQEAEGGVTFNKLSPQKVQNTTAGFIVQVASRAAVEYVEPTRKAVVEVDFSTSVGVFGATLRGWFGASNSPMTQGERSTVLERIAAGLAAMGMDVDLC